MGICPFCNRERRPECQPDFNGVLPDGTLCPNLAAVAYEQVEKRDMERFVRHAEFIMPKRFAHLNLDPETPGWLGWQKIALPRLTDWVRATVDGTGRGKNLLIKGARSGVGKTHLASAALNECISQGRMTGIFCEMRKMLALFRDTQFRSPGEGDGRLSIEDVRDVIIGCKVLLLDDFTTVDVSAWQRGHLCEVVNGRYEHLRPTIITTTQSVEAMEANSAWRRMTVQLFKDGRCEFVNVDAVPAKEKAPGASQGPLEDDRALMRQGERAAIKRSLG